MSEIRTATLSNLAGTGPATLTGQIAAKVWVNYTQSTPVVNNSFNVSSVSDDSTGIYTINYTAAMADTTSAVSGLASGNAYGSWVIQTATSVGRRTWGYGGTTLTDLTSTTAVIGDLA